MQIEINVVVTPDTTGAQPTTRDYKLTTTRRNDIWVARSTDPAIVGVDTGHPYSAAMAYIVQDMANVNTQVGQ